MSLSSSDDSEGSSVIDLDLTIDDLVGVHGHYPHGTVGLGLAKPILGARFWHWARSIYLCSFLLFFSNEYAGQELRVTGPLGRGVEQQNRWEFWEKECAFAAFGSHDFYTVT